MQSKYCMCIDANIKVNWRHRFRTSDFIRVLAYCSMFSHTLIPKTHQIQIHEHSRWTDVPCSTVLLWHGATTSLRCCDTFCFGCARPSRCSRWHQFTGVCRTDVRVRITQGWQGSPATGGATCRAPESRSAISAPVSVHNSNDFFSSMRQWWTLLNWYIFPS